MQEVVVTENRGRVRIITINRPEVLNAWNGAVSAGLDAALQAAADDDSVGAVVVTGAGRAFCAGADLSSGPDTFASGGTARPGDDVEARSPKCFPWDVPKPVIAAINGHAVGVGATYALACDVRFIAEDAKIGFVFTRRGMLAELGSHAILPRVVGLSNASDLILSGRPVDGVEATRLGLASACAGKADVLAMAIARADEMASMSAPVSMAISKRLLWESIGLDAMRKREEPLFDWVSNQPDSIEGVASFLDKRVPDWKMSAARDFPHDLFD